MPYIKPLDRDDLPQFKQLFDHYQSTRGFVPNSILTMSRRPAIADAFMALNKAVLYEGTVSEELKMLVSLIVSQASGCKYCQAHMANLSSIYEASAQKIQAIWDFQSSDLFSDAERASLNLAYQVTIDPNADHQALFDQLKRYFDDAEIVELVATMSLFGYLNRWNDAMATSLEEHAEKVAVDIIGQKGWEKDKHQ